MSVPEVISQGKGHPMMRRRRGLGRWLEAAPPTYDVAAEEGGLDRRGWRSPPNPIMVLLYCVYIITLILTYSSSSYAIVLFCYSPKFPRCTYYTGLTITARDLQVRRLQSCWAPKCFPHFCQPVSWRVCQPPFRSAGSLVCPMVAKKWIV